MAGAGDIAIRTGPPSRFGASTSGTPAAAGVPECGRDRRRSGDLPLFRRSLCLLSYPTELRRDRGHDERSGAVPTGFEPATSGLTGRRALQAAPRDRITTAEAAKGRLYSASASVPHSFAASVRADGPGMVRASG